MRRADTATASTLIKEGLCSALCLVAVHREAVSCSCPCGGAYHAHFADVHIALAPGHTLQGAAAAMAGQLSLDLDTVA